MSIHKSMPTAKPVTDPPTWRVRYTVAATGEILVNEYRTESLANHGMELLRREGFRDIVLVPPEHRGRYHIEYRQVLGDNAGAWTRTWSTEDGPDAVNYLRELVEIESCLVVPGSPHREYRMTYEVSRAGGAS